MASREEENFLVIVLLLMKFGSRVLQEKIKCQLGKEKQSLEVFLKEKKHDIFHLTLTEHCCLKTCKKKNRRIPLPPSILTQMYIDKDTLESCKDTSRDCCFCVLEPKSELDICGWDITLTSCLLLEIFCLSNSDKIKRIKSLRNLRNSQLMLHRGNASLSYDNYITSFTDLSTIIKEIASTCDKSFCKKICYEIEELNKNRLSQKEIDEAQEYWKEIMKNVAWKHDTETKNIESKGCNVQSKFSHRIKRSAGHLSYHYITTLGIVH